LRCGNPDFVKHSWIASQTALAMTVVQSWAPAMTILSTSLNNRNSEYGYIHSVETCGTVDGPGLRYVIFFQGCLLRCMYCHNPDCFVMQAGKKMHVDEIIQDIKKYLPYIKHGGVTLSGGEPFLQADFACELLYRIKQLGLHTAIDTSGYVVTQAMINPGLPYCSEAAIGRQDLDLAIKPEKNANIMDKQLPIQVVEKVLRFTDLILLDIKAIEPDLFKQITGVPITLTLEFAEYLKKINKPTWIRFVLVPGLTDSLDHVHKLAQYCATLTNVEKVEILPFHKLGEYKWQELGYNYQLKDALEPTIEQIQSIKKIFALYGLIV